MLKEIPEKCKPNAKQTTNCEGNLVGAYLRDAPHKQELLLQTSDYINYVTIPTDSILY